MRINLRTDRIEIEGYVNAVDRFSSPMKAPDGSIFIEKISPGAFRKTVDSGGLVRVLHNHRDERELSRSGAPGFELYEDNVGLFCRFETADRLIMKKAREKKLVGWSFGFFDIVRDKVKSERSGIDTEETVRELELVEVTVVDDERTPIYPATSIHVRSDGTQGSCNLRSGLNGDSAAYFGRLRISRPEEAAKFEKRQRELLIKLTDSYN